MNLNFALIVVLLIVGLFFLDIDERDGGQHVWGALQQSSPANGVDYDNQ